MNDNDLIKATIEMVKRQATYSLMLAYLPKPTWAEAQKIAERPSSKNPGEPRWHDFLEPTVRDTVLGMEKACGSVEASSKSSTTSGLTTSPPTKGTP